MNSNRHFPRSSGSPRHCTRIWLCIIYHYIVGAHILIKIIQPVSRIVSNYELLTFHLQMKH